MFNDILVVLLWVVALRLNGEVRHPHTNGEQYQKIAH